MLLRLLSALPFAIYYSSLQLYLINIHFAKTVSTTFVGSILALSFASSLIGGVIVNFLIGYRAFFIFCLVCQAFGCLTFSTGSHEAILWYSSLFLLGSSGITISLNMMVTQQFEPNNSMREKFFFWLYFSLNLGYFIGYSIAGYYSKLNAYHNIAIVIAISSLLGVLLALPNRDGSDNSRKYSKKNLLYFIILTIFLLFIFRLFLKFYYITNILIIISWLFAALAMLFLLMKNYYKQRQDIIAFHILLLSALIFWSVYFLAPMALIVFINNHVDLTIIDFHIAPQWIQNINTVLISLGTIYIGQKISTKTIRVSYVVTQFSLGLLFLAIGFIILAVGITLTASAEKIALIWIFCSYISQSIGELFIGPMGFALIGKLIPHKHQSIMMGVWVTLLGVGCAAAGQLSRLAPYDKTESSTLILTSYMHFFLWIGIVVIIFSLLLYVIRKRFFHVL